MKRLISRIAQAAKPKPQTEPTTTIAPQITLENFPQELPPQLIRNYLELLSRGQLTTEDVIEDIFFYDGAIQEEIIADLPRPYTPLSTSTTKQETTEELKELIAKPNAKIAADFQDRQKILTQKSLGVKRFSIQASPEGNPPFIDKIESAINTSLAHHITPDNAHLVQEVAGKINHAFSTQNTLLQKEVRAELAIQSPYEWNQTRIEKLRSTIEEIDMADAPESLETASLD